MENDLFLNDELRTIYNSTQQKITLNQTLPTKYSTRSTKI